jgi:hypothetical protein
MQNCDKLYQKCVKMKFRKIDLFLFFINWFDLYIGLIIKIPK